MFLTMKKKGKEFLKKSPSFINFFPFNNKLILSGTDVDLEGILMHCVVKCSGNGNRIKICRGGVLRNCNITIMGDNNTLFIEEDVSMIDGRIVICDSDNLVTIGANTSFNKNVVLDCMEGRKIVIGETCMFSADIVVRNGDWHSIFDAEGKRINCSKDVVIGKHCWIGDHVSITKGGSLAEGTVVGTGSIVTNRMEEKNTVIAGNPAKILKRNIRWDVARTNKIKNG